MRHELDIEVEKVFLIDDGVMQIETEEGRTLSVALESPDRASFLKAKFGVRGEV